VNRSRWLDLQADAYAYFLVPAAIIVAAAAGMAVGRRASGAPASLSGPAGP
jgi:hypothetical protein